MPMLRVYQWFNALNYGLFPPLCRLCGEHGAPGIDLCGPCRSEFPAQPDALAMRAGSVLAGFIYAEPVAGLIQAFKFHDDLAAGRLLARLSMPAFAGSVPQALIPVPLHGSRLRQRGFNQILFAQ